MALEDESEATNERLRCRLKQISLLLQVKDEHHDRFKILAAHHLRKNLSFSQLKSLLNDTSRQSTIKSAVTFAAVTFLDTYGPALWPYNSKTRSHLLNAPLSCWRRKRGSYGPVYVKDAFMTESSKQTYRRKSGDINPTEDENRALSKMGKFMTEYFDALLHVIDDDGNEDKYDGQKLLSAIVGQGTSDMRGSPGVVSQDVERTARPNISRESSPDEPLIHAVSRKRAQRRDSNGSSSSIIAHASFDHSSTRTETIDGTSAHGLPSRDSSPEAPLALQRLHSMFGLRNDPQANLLPATGYTTAEAATRQTETIGETSAHNGESRESTPEVPIVVERLHQLLAIPFERPTAKTPTAVPQQGSRSQDTITTPGTASTPSNDQASTTASAPLQSQGLSSQPDMEDSDRDGPGILTGTMTCEALDTAVANFGAYMQNSFHRNIDGQPRTIAVDVQNPAPVMQRPQQRTADATSSSTANPADDADFPPDPPPQINNASRRSAPRVGNVRNPRRPKVGSYQSTLGSAHPRATIDAGSGTTIRRCIPDTSRTGPPAGNKRRRRGDDGQSAPKRRAVEMLPPPAFPPMTPESIAVETPPPPVFLPMTPESMWRPLPRNDQEYNEMLARLNQYRIDTGGLGGLPRV